MESFFNLKTPTEVFSLIDRFKPVGEEHVPLRHALGRVLSHEVISTESLPDFSRSAMDGYAVRARDTYGASEALPALLEVTGEVLMGHSPTVAVGEGQAVKVSTGGMLPDGADAVVMKEFCHALDASTMEASKTVSPLENVISAGDDFREGEKVLEKGHRMRSQDLGVMAGTGQSHVRVYRRPKVGIISTGDEIVSVEASPRPGQVRDINGYTLSAFCRRAGGDPVYLGLCPDDFQSLKKMVEGALHNTDTVWISGGSSVGTRDITLKVFESLRGFELLVHGISISPGKPTIIGLSEGKPIVGLPGHVASALVVAEVFLSHALRRLSGQVGSSRALCWEVEAELGRNIESAGGREDYVRVKLVERQEGYVAEPVFGKSGLISTLVASDGLVRIDMNTEGLYQGQRVKVMIFDPI